jgi:hypothetical protein
VRAPRDISTIEICGYALRPVDPRSTNAVELESEDAENRDTPEQLQSNIRDNSDTSLL